MKSSLTTTRNTQLLTISYLTKTTAFICYFARGSRSRKHFDAALAFIFFESLKKILFGLKQTNLFTPKINK